MTGARKTAEELGIHPRELEALLWVRDALDPAIPDKDLPSWIKFDMSTWSDLEAEDEGDGVPLTKCGTACCIGGSMEVYLSGKYKRAVGDVLSTVEIREIDNSLDGLEGGAFASCTGVLRPLFFNWGLAPSRDRRHAVAAIDRFLAGNTQDPWLTEAEY